MHGNLGIDCLHCGKTFTPPRTDRPSRRRKSCSLRCARLLAWNNAGRRAKHANDMIELWSDPDHRETRRKQISAGMIDGHKRNPDWSKKVAAKNRTAWANPKRRKGYVETLTAVNRQPHRREAERDRALKQWEQDAHRELMRQLGRERTANPDFRKNLSEKAKSGWKDPVYRAKRTRESAADLLTTIQGYLPRTLPDFARADLEQDIVLALLEGQVKIDGLNAKQFIADYQRRFPQKWGPTSLDAPLAGTDGLTLMDTLADDVEHF